MLRFPYLVQELNEQCAPILQQADKLVSNVHCTEVLGSACDCMYYQVINIGLQMDVARDRLKKLQAAAPEVITGLTQLEQLDSEVGQLCEKISTKLKVGSVNILLINAGQCTYFAVGMGGA